MVDLLVVPDFLDAAAHGELMAALRESAGAAATVLSAAAGGAVHASVRKATRVAVPAEVREALRQRLLARKAEIEAHFGVALNDCEEPQFLRYEEGDFFVPHQDGNTPLVYDDSRHRRISAVIFLSTHSDEPTPDTYGGGSLLFHRPYSEPGEPIPAPATPGTLVLFRAETTHEVTPVTHGERYTIATWFR
ncbi:MAG TPA: 2OG-Fe(II) oxygenase [Longimicrobiaceae bacterium]|jgi:predicted 2-oxoglutarate/Fe(II)-dependent dioxygenase YbiX|nr:2OG-Fe(II) oxygenase [Longimicrobiaceae bacterium]